METIPVIRPDPVKDPLATDIALCERLFVRNNTRYTGRYDDRKNIHTAFGKHILERNRPEGHMSEATFDKCMKQLNIKTFTIDGRVSDVYKIRLKKECRHLIFPNR